MIFNTLAADADTEWIMIDSTMIRAHQHAAGARKISSMVRQNKSWEDPAAVSLRRSTQLVTR
jgi:hypothetical protein